MPNSWGKERKKARQKRQLRLKGKGVCPEEERETGSRHKELFRTITRPPEKLAEKPKKNK